MNKERINKYLKDNCLLKDQEVANIFNRFRLSGVKIWDLEDKVLYGFSREEIVRSTLLETWGTTRVPILEPTMVLGRMDRKGVDLTGQLIVPEEGLSTLKVQVKSVKEDMYGFYSQMSEQLGTYDTSDALCVCWAKGIVCITAEKLKTREGIEEGIRIQFSKFLNYRDNLAREYDKVPDGLPVVRRHNDTIEYARKNGRKNRAKTFSWN